MLQADHFQLHRRVRLTPGASLLLQVNAVSVCEAQAGGWIQLHLAAAKPVSCTMTECGLYTGPDIKSTIHGGGAVAGECLVQHE